MSHWLLDQIVESTSGGFQRQNKNGKGQTLNFKAVDTTIIDGMCLNVCQSGNMLLFAFPSTLAQIINTLTDKQFKNSTIAIILLGYNVSFLVFSINIGPTMVNIDMSQ